MQVEEEDVLKAIRTFSAGSSGGPDGIRLQHILDLVSCRETGQELLMAITGFVNILLEDKCNKDIKPILFGGQLIALEKQSGRICPNRSRIHTETHCSEMCQRICNRYDYRLPSTDPGRSRHTRWMRGRSTFY